MKFDIDKAAEVLRRTPATLSAMLAGLSPEWTGSDADTENWQPYDVIGHLVHGEKTNWIPRAKVILSQDAGAEFVPFDRFAQFADSKGKSIEILLGEFSSLRSESLETLRSWDLGPEQLALQSTHPELGSVTLGHLLATWVVHDLTHLRQIATAMALRYRGNVGPWKEYLSILS